MQLLADEVPINCPQFTDLRMPNTNENTVYTAKRSRKCEELNPNHKDSTNQQ